MILQGSKNEVIQNFDSALIIISRGNSSENNVKSKDAVQNRSFCCNFLQALVSYGVKLCTCLSSSIHTINQQLDFCFESIQVLSFIERVFDENIIDRLKEFYAYDKWLNLTLSVIELAFNLSFELEIADSDSEEVQKCRNFSYTGLLPLLESSIAVRFLTKVDLLLSILLFISIILLSLPSRQLDTFKFLSILKRKKKIYFP